MILQALKGYYDRKAADPDSGVAPEGFMWKEIPYVISLNPEGEVIGLESTYEGEGRSRRAKRFLVPQAVKRSVGIVANALWDSPDYALGIDVKGKPDRVPKQHAAFKEKVAALSEQAGCGLAAVRGFLDRPDKTTLLEGFGETWKTLCEDGGYVTFRLAGQSGIIAAQPSVQAAIRKARLAGEGEEGLCLVTGDSDAIARLHPAIKGVQGA